MQVTETTTDKQPSPRALATAEAIASIEPMVSAEVVAHAAASTIPTVHEWVRKGLITPAIREGRVIRFRLSEVMAQLEQRATSKAGKEGE